MEPCSLMPGPARPGFARLPDEVAIACHWSLGLWAAPLLVQYVQQSLATVGINRPAIEPATLNLLTSASSGLARRTTAGREESGGTHAVLCRTNHSTIRFQVSQNTIV